MVEGGTTAKTRHAAIRHAIDIHGDGVNPVLQPARRVRQDVRSRKAELTPPFRAADHFPLDQEGMTEKLARTPDLARLQRLVDCGGGNGMLS